jgi:DNA helicase-2/ATP-dependent DNA helicase PcrA
MKNKLIIAAAGAGKTTYLVKEALKHKNGRVLITTYTQANEAEIRKKIIKINKCIPGNITVQTWFSFLLQHGARPYQGCLFEKNIKGLILVNRQSGLKYCSKGKPVYFSESEEFEKYFFSNGLKIYSDKLSKFVFRCNEKTKGQVIDRLSRIYSHIFVDEVQDLAGYDLEILKLIFESKSDILMVGDPRQVTYLTHHEPKYRKYKKGKIKEFILEKCKKEICEIDETALNDSHRCCEAICVFSSRLYPHLKMCASRQNEKTIHDGVFLIKPQDVDLYLERYRPRELYYKLARYPALNFGESKGLGFRRVLIHPTEPIIQYLTDGKLTKTIKNTKTGKNEEKEAFDIAKFYVAITRASHSVGIIYDYDDNTNIPGTFKFQ